MWQGFFLTRGGQISTEENTLKYERILTSASLSKRANSSFSSFTSSWALQAEDSWVKPTMSANRILQRKCTCCNVKHKKVSILTPPRIKADFVNPTWRFHGGTCTSCWTVAAELPFAWPGSSCPAASHQRYVWAGWTVIIPPTWRHTVEECEICHVRQWQAQNKLPRACT